jgi:hypothetical protein
MRKTKTRQAKGNEMKSVHIITWGQGGGLS